MPRFVVNPERPETWVIELQPGIVSLGRSPENDYPIEHPSVSSSHCRITFSDAGVWIKDLGSTVGTFIDGELVEEARLKSGQMVGLGEIIMRFESTDVEQEPVVSAVPALPPRLTAFPVSAQNPFCKFHPQTPGRFTCPKCGRNLCELCVHTRLVNGETRRYCHTCGSECALAQALAPATQSPPGFFSALPRAFLYPFQGSGIILLVGGSAFFFILNHLPLLGLLFTGYLFSYAKSIITSTAGGRHEPPDWPDFSDWKDDIVVPYLQLLALAVLSFGPACILGLWRSGSEIYARVAFFAALGFGAMIAPMGMLALSMFDTVTALNPIALAWSILRVPLDYLVAAAAFELVLVFHWFAEGALRSWLPVPLVPDLISSFLYLYLIVSGMRILGLLYLVRSEDLGWFSRSTA